MKILVANVQGRHDERDIALEEITDKFNGLAIEAAKSGGALGGAASASRTRGNWTGACSRWEASGPAVSHSRPRWKKSEFGFAPELVNQ